MTLNAIFIGDLNVHTESKSKCDGFKNIGWNVMSMSSERIPHFPGLCDATTIFGKLVKKIQPMPDPNRVNEQLRKFAEDGSLAAIDIIWSDKAINIRPSTFALIKAKSPSTKLFQH